MCITKARIAITTATIQFMHLVLVHALQTVLHLFHDTSHTHLMQLK